MSSGMLLEPSLSQLTQLRDWEGMGTDLSEEELPGRSLLPVGDEAPGCRLTLGHGKGGSRVTE